MFQHFLLCIRGYQDGRTNVMFDLVPNKVTPCLFIYIFFCLSRDDPVSVEDVSTWCQCLLLVEDHEHMNMHLLHFHPRFLPSNLKKKTPHPPKKPMSILSNKFLLTLPESNIAPENQWLEDEIPLGGQSPIYTLENSHATL